MADDGPPLRAHNVYADRENQPFTLNLRVTADTPEQAIEITRQAIREEERKMGVKFNDLQIRVKEDT